MALANLVYWAVECVLSLLYALLYAFQPRRVPPPLLSQLTPAVDEQIFQLSATELARRLRSREVTSRAVVSAYIARIKQVNAVVNAVTEELFDQAMREADAADKELNTAHEDTSVDLSQKPFLGVPLTVKDQFEIRGTLATLGLYYRRAIRSTRDADAVAALRRAGFIVVCKTNMPELGMWIETHNWQWGRTSNPHDSWRTCGGSSGGEGALVGAGASVVGLGSDIGGSIRYPAAFCGVFGHKCTRQLVKVHHQDGAYSPAICEAKKMLRSYGPLARRAEDIWPFLSIIADPSKMERLAFKSPKQVDLKTVKIYYLKQLPTEKGNFVCDVDSDVQQGLMEAVNSLKADGLDVAPLPPDLFKLKPSSSRSPFPLHGLGYLAALSRITPADVELADSLGLAVSDPRAPGGKRVQNTLEMMLGPEGNADSFPVLWNTLKSLLFPMLNHRHKLFTLFFALLPKLPVDKSLVAHTESEMQSLVKRVDDWFAEQSNRAVILLPVYPHKAPLHRLPLATPFDFVYTLLFSALGLPVTAIPVGRTGSGRGPKGGLPLAVQAVGAKHCDAVTVAVAMRLEKLLGGWVQPY